MMVVETGYSWAPDNGDKYNNIFLAKDDVRDNAISGDDQYRRLKGLIRVITNGGGKGIQYWEPAWITSKLNDGWAASFGWDNITLFDFNGKVLKGANYMCCPNKF